uniref:Phosphatidylethanolamine-binding protein n=1 Tax=Steinernema glaseri TaxID=37863 RepID=A0A1I8A3L7_9BILA
MNLLKVVMSVSESFEKHEVVLDVVPLAPKDLAKVVYTEGVEANLGNELTPTQVKDSPCVTWDVEAGALYTLVMTDPDAPSRAEPKAREFEHWLVVNIPGNEVSKGDVLAPYVGAGPPQGTGLHRYVFLIYKQPGKVVDKEHGSNPGREKRRSWKVAAFAEKHKLGSPVAGNLFQAQWDEYVPILHKKLAG